MQTLYKQREAAALLCLSERTLERFRVSGDGPSFVKAARRVLYSQSDLDQWIEARIRHFYKRAEARTMTDLQLIATAPEDGSSSAALGSTLGISPRS